MNTTTAKDHVVAGRLVYRVGNVSTPTLTLYPAKATSTGPAVSYSPEADTAFSPLISKAPRCATG